MTSETVAAALARLHAAAAQTRAGWTPTAWKSADGSTLRMVASSFQNDPFSVFQGLRVRPGEHVRLACHLDLPANVAGVDIEGEPLDVVLNSLYPTHAFVSERRVFADEGVPVAAGPAQIRLVDSVCVGDNGELELHIRIPDHQTYDSWVAALNFTTPGLRARFDLLDTAWAQLLLADRFATDAEERATIEEVAVLIPSDVIGADGAAVERAVGRLVDALPDVGERIRAVRVHCVGHSHIDLAWLWRWADTVEVIRRDVRSVLEMMDDYPEMCFTHSQPAGYEVVQTQEPQLFEKIVEYVATGRWEAATMQWVEGDVNLASGEAQCRQLLEGVHWTEDHLGRRPEVFLAPDTFGHAGNLPQLARSAGARVYYHHRGNPGVVGGGRLTPAYWWEGDDGTRVLAISTPAYLGHVTVGDIARAALHQGVEHGHATVLHFYGVGDHGGGPTRRSLDSLRRLQQTPLMPTVFCSTLTQFADEISSAPLPVHRGESKTVFEGSYTTHADTKLYNRDGENTLTCAETLSVLAGIDCTHDLAGAWRKVLFNQFHDILGGSAIHEVYEDSKRQFEEASAVARDVTGRALDVLTAHCAPGEIAVTNPLGFERTDVVVVRGLEGRGAAWVEREGHRTVGQYADEGFVFLARVPPFATVAYRVGEPAATEPAIQVVDDVTSPLAGAPFLLVDTPLYAAGVRRDSGVIGSFFDKHAGREVVGYGHGRPPAMEQVRSDLAWNVVQLVDEHPHAMSAWSLDEVHREQSLLRAGSLRCVEQGPVRAVFEAKHAFRDSQLTMRLYFYADLMRIDVRAAIDWQEVGSPTVGVPGLKVSFGSRLDECEAWFETPFGAARRPSDGMETPALRWADVGGRDYGVAVLNDSKYGYDALGTRLRLTLLRSAYDPDAISDAGAHEVSWAALPHVGDWRSANVVAHAAGFNQPLIVRLVGEPSGALASGFREFRPRVDGAPSVHVACMKHAHRGTGKVIRLYESAGKPATATVTGLPADATVTEVDVTERVVRPVATRDGNAIVTFRPHQVLSLMVD